MRALSLLFLLAFGTASAQVRDVHYQGDLTPLNTTPTFDRGYLVVYDWGHRIDLFSPDGVLIYKATAQAPAGDSTIIQNAAVDSDGTVALAVRAVSARDRMRGGAIAILDPTGIQSGFFDIGDYLPTQVAFGPDHSIWTLGYLGEQPGALAPNYSMLRKYARDGKQLGEFLPRASFLSLESAGREPLIMPMLGLWELRVANGRVEAIFHRTHMWVQTDLNGQETGRWDTGPNGRPFAITQDGRAWRTDGHDLKVYDRTAGLWQPVAFDVPDGTLLGADGNRLVFLLTHENSVRWLPAPAAPLW